jgi:hypothetical protein
MLSALAAASSVVVGPPALVGLGDVPHGACGSVQGASMRA